MSRFLHKLAAAAFVAMSGALAAWAVTALGPIVGTVLALPLAVSSMFVFRHSVRPLVAAGALALPYLCIAMVEIIAAPVRSPLAILALACGVLFMSLLAPVTRNARLAAAPRRN